MKLCILAAIAVLLLAYPLTVLSGASVSRETAATVTQTPEQTETPLATSTPLKASQMTLRAAVAAAFPDVTQMTDVVRCESHFRQFDSTGKPLMSATNDVGVMQINIPTWGALAKLLRLDIYNSASDNIAMARIIYRQQGLQAWTCKG